MNVVFGKPNWYNIVARKTTTIDECVYFCFCQEKQPTYVATYEIKCGYPYFAKIDIDNLATFNKYFFVNDLASLIVFYKGNKYTLNEVSDKTFNSTDGI